jgi:hypothetical protein
VTAAVWRLGFNVLIFIYAAGFPATLATPQVTRDTASVNFPFGILFELEATSAASLESAILHYGADGRACNPGGAQQSVKFDPAASISVEWEWDFSRAGVLPPGVRFWWQWELRDAAGGALLTAKQWDTVSDGRYDWQSLQRPALTVTWAEGSQAFGTGLLDLSLSSLERLESEMGVAPAGPVLLVVYPDTDAVGEALRYLPEWTGGVAYPAYNLVVTGIAPGEAAWAEDVLPHELAHLVVGALTFNCKGASLPTWLNEGLAVTAEGDPPAADLERLQAALRAGTLPPLRSLANGFQADAGQAALSYAQSGEVVRHLLRAYEPALLAQLLAAVRDGARIDPALQAVYGFDTNGLDAAWREAQGAPATPPSGGAATASAERTAVPTLALWTAVPTPSATLAPTPTAPRASPTARSVAQAATPTHSQPSPAAATQASPVPVAGVRWELWASGLAALALLALLAWLARKLLLTRK